MYLLIVTLPLFGSLITGLFGRYLGYRGAALVTTGCVGLSVCGSVAAFYEVAICGSICTLCLSPWFTTELFDAVWGFYFDTLTVVMLLVVTSVSFCVHIYSISYMSHDPHIPRFMCYLSIFTFFMLFLVTSDNLLQMFFGWEGVGLASYLLISFWFTRLQASKASIKAMLMNRIGDMGLALGIMGIFSVAGTVNFTCLFAVVPELAYKESIWCNMQVHTLSVICILLFIGATGKSAQLGLHTWLPDAMEGPTPVSALIHAATMVTAGVFLICRCSPLFEYAPQALTVVALLGACTCFFAATCGCVQNDIKRVIAYSTCSQLGYMVFACGLSAYNVAAFHLMNHAFFKALLFLSAGSVIHALSDEQDMRKMGGAAKVLPFTYAMMLIGSLSLAGFPFLSGFYSKDLILEYASTCYTFTGNFTYLCGALVVLLTSYYSFRLCMYTFSGSSRSFKANLYTALESPFLMAFPLILLALASIYGGFMTMDMMIGAGGNFWGNSLYVNPYNYAAVESAYIPQNTRLLPFFFTLCGISLAFFSINGIPGLTYNTSKARNPLTPNGLTDRAPTVFAQIYKTYLLAEVPLYRKMYVLFSKRWFFDKVYNDFFAEKALSFGYSVSWKSIDKGFLEMCGPLGIAQTFPLWSRNLSGLQSGIIYHYAVTMLLGLTFAISVVALWHIFEPFIEGKYYLLYACTFLVAHSTK